MAFRAIVLLLLAAAGLAGQVPGKFDYYVLALSWSPEYCASQGGVRDQLQCVDRRYGFVTHGLWPQYERGFPSRCRGGGEVSDEVVRRMLDIMPSPGLIRHEWEAHGRCSGLGAGAYFDLIRRFYGNVRIPRQFQEPVKTVLIEPAALKQRFADANAGLPLTSLAVFCSGRNLRELRVCLSKDGKPRRCGADVRDACRVKKAVMRPVR